MGTGYLMQTLIQENRSRIRAIIRKMTGSYNEDIEQEVYLKTWESQEQYQERGNFKAWITTLTANLCRDYFRTKAYKTQILIIKKIIYHFSDICNTLDYFLTFFSNLYNNQ